MANHLKRVIRHTVVFCALLFALTPNASCQRKQAASPSPAEQAAAAKREGRGVIWREIPSQIDTSARYLFYLHGMIVENFGIRPTSPEHGVYEYEQILDTLAGKGFVVISEPRPKGTVATEYAAKVAGQINRLISAGRRARAHYGRRRIPRRSHSHRRLLAVEKQKP
nr:Unknown Function [uncultured bacterium]